MEPINSRVRLYGRFSINFLSTAEYTSAEETTEYKSFTRIQKLSKGFKADIETFEIQFLGWQQHSKNHTKVICTLLGVSNTR